MSHDQTFRKWSGTSQYIASEDLIDSVNVAIALERPLLIRGEPGTGKTLLARAIADGLNRPFLSWHVKSTTKAKDGLYTYDTVQRLNDSRFGDGNVSNIKDYIKLGPLGQAFASEEQTVILIDEIDKADIEFPNDLLHELDEMSFYIPETNETIKATTRPIIIISSNAEKELPDAFLRRCVFHYINFPDQNHMKNIVDVHFENLDKKLLDHCLMKFYMIRDLPDLTKKPSTSELIDWIQALIRGGISHKEVKNHFPFMGTLLKKESDLESFSRQRNW